MTDDLKTKCEKTFYSELYHFEETSQGLLIDETTGHIYLKKTLDTYDKDVYGWLISNRNLHIPAIHSCREENGKLIVLEEYIQGETLETLLASGTLSESERIRIILDVCDALSFLHSAESPIIHRDIKPSNIMITGDGVVKLIDYDAAKVFHQGKQEDTTLIGTVGRAAPEQYGFAQSDARTDVYSMGLLIREMFPDDRRFFAVISRATVMDPKDRYQTIAELKTAVCNAVSRPAGRKSRAWVIILVLAAVFILCLAAFFTGLQSGRGRGYDMTEAAAESVNEGAGETVMPQEPEYEDTGEDVITQESVHEDTGESDMYQETGEYTEDSGPVIEETCWYISESYDNDYIHTGVVLGNRNEREKMVSPKVRITARDKSGIILGTEELGGGSIKPGDHIALSGLISISDYGSADDVSVDFSIASWETEADNDGARSTDFIVERISDKPNELFPKVTGEITSEYKEKTDISVSALLRNDGKLVACEGEYLQDLNPGVPTAFEVTLPSTAPEHDSVEIMVKAW